MSATNDDLHLQIARLEGKVDSLAQTAADLKQNFLGVAAIAKEVGAISSKLDVTISLVDRTRTDIHDINLWRHEHNLWADKNIKEIREALDGNHREAEKAIGRLENFRWYIMGAVAVTIILGGWFVNDIKDRLSATSNLAQIVSSDNATQELRLRALERKVDIVTPIQDGKR